MIVLDENLDEPDVLPPIKLWARGKVVSARELRRGTVVKDEAIPRLLSQQRQPTFLTTNATDFWRRVPAHRRYCIICFPLPDDRQGEISDLLRRLVRLPDFKTKRARMGKVVRVSRGGIQFYKADAKVYVLAWTTT